jgi:hypothetical protein
MHTPGVNTLTRTKNLAANLSSEITELHDFRPVTNSASLLIYCENNDLFLVGLL